MALERTFVTVELADGRVIGPVRVINADVIAWESTARKHGWRGPSQDKTGTTDLGDINLRSTFQAWRALSRTGVYSGGWEQFKDECLDIDLDTEEVDGTAVEAFPTSPAPGHDSSSI